MRVTVKLFGGLRKYLPASTDRCVEIELPDGATAVDLLARLRIPPDHVGVIAANQQQVEKTATLHDGDELHVFAPLAGGL